jgi:hypothetical protein
MNYWTHDFNTKVIVADASIVDPNVIQQHISEFLYLCAIWIKVLVPLKTDLVLFSYDPLLIKWYGL